MNLLILLFGVSGGEIVLIFVAALLLFGSKGLPDVARGLGKGLKELQKATDDIKREINNSSSGALDEITKVRDDLTNKVRDEINNNVNNVGDKLKVD
jgi:sec-independent protein translocase protein TatA